MTTNPTNHDPLSSSPGLGEDWDQYWCEVRNEDWITARRLLDISPRVRGLYALHLVEELTPRYDVDGTELDEPRRDLNLDWQAAADRIDSDGLSSTESRLAHLVAALTTDESLNLASLTVMGTWTFEVWQALAEWGTDGAATLANTPFGAARADALARWRPSVAEPS